MKLKTCSPGCRLTAAVALFILLGLAPGSAMADLQGGTVRLFNRLGAPCPSPCTSGVTTITLLSNPTPDTVEISVSIALDAPEAIDEEAASLKLDFDFLGRPTDEPVHLVVHWHNTGAVDWAETVQTAIPIHWSPQIFPIIWGAGAEALAGPSSIALDNLVSDPPAGSVKPGFETPWYLPASTLIEDPLLGPLGIPADTVAVGVFALAPVLAAGQSATIESDLAFLVAPQNCGEFDLGCESGIVQVALTFAAAPVQEAPPPPAQETIPTLPLPWLAGLFAALAVVATRGRNRRVG